MIILPFKYIFLVSYGKKDTPGDYKSNIKKNTKKILKLIWKCFICVGTGSVLNERLIGGGAIDQTTHTDFSGIKMCKFDCEFFWLIYYYKHKPIAILAVLKSFW